MYRWINSKNVDWKFVRIKIMDHSSVKLNEDQVPGAKLTVNSEKLGKNEAVQWLKCRNASNLSKLNLTELREK